MMTTDFLVGAIRASRDLHPQVKTELEEILARQEPLEPTKLNGTAWCGACGCHLRKIGMNIRDEFCGRCGQRVMWE